MPEQKEGTSSCGKVSWSGATVIEVSVGVGCEPSFCWRSCSCPSLCSSCLHIERVSDAMEEEFRDGNDGNGGADEREPESMLLLCNVAAAKPADTI